jgi:hypothetical protein
VIDSPFPDSFDYASVGPYTVICVRRDGTGLVKRKRRLLRAMIVPFERVDDDDRLFTQVIDRHGFVLFHHRAGGVLMGTGEAFATLTVMADMIGAPWMHDGLLSLELESRVMWPAVTA